MRLLADLHVHTLASDGYCTVLELAEAARLRGLELIAITDHGPGIPRGAHAQYFRNLKAVAGVITGVRVLKGCEANVSAGTANKLDLGDELLEGLDFVIAGFHAGTGFDDRDIDTNTSALLEVCANPLVDMISHPGNDLEFPVHLEPVVAAAAQHRVILELNNHSFDRSTQRSAAAEREREFAAAAKAAGALLAIGSDAHFANRVGVFDSAVEVAEQVGIGVDDLVNRDGRSALDFICGKRTRPNLGAGGEWDSQATAAARAAKPSAASDRRSRDAAVIEALMRLKDAEGSTDS